MPWGLNFFIGTWRSISEACSGFFMLFPLDLLLIVLHTIKTSLFQVFCPDYRSYFKAKETLKCPVEENAN
jgi:hypothetical protein